MSLTTNPTSHADFLDRDALHAIQFERLERIVRHTYQNVSWYREKMNAVGVTPDDIRSLHDIQKLPFVVKDDLRATYPFGMFAVPMTDVVRFHASSGTTGKPIVVAYTHDDLRVWREVIVRSLVSFGLTSRDILQNAYGYGLFTGGLGLHAGAEELGMTVVPISGGNTERQLMLLRDFGATAISCTPSYFTHLIEKGVEMGINLRELSSLRVGIFGAEPWTDAMRSIIEAGSAIKAFDIYGLTEIVGPGVGAECEHQCGLHIFEDHFYPEIIDPETLEPLGDDRDGELVFTTLSKWAMPLLRYRTRDITRLVSEPCKCGRTLRRLKRITHRSDDMLIIRGVNLFPGQIEDALLRVEGVVPCYQIVITREHGLDNVEVLVEMQSDSFSDTIRDVESLQRSLRHQIEHTVGIRVKVTLAAPNTIPRSEGKAKRVVDKRSL
ncbi:MAG: phenylacetate--CoA ligase family protein [Thermoguttaceae bacterium]